MRALVAVVVVGVAAAATAATASSRSHDGPGGPVTVHLVVRHSRFVPEAVEVPAGTTVRFVVRNLDPIAHELIVGDGAVHERHRYGTEAHHGDRPGEVSVAAGATAETTFLPAHPGDVVFGCHLPGHWDYGMQGVLRVA